jgi:hypothetical protein
MAIEANDWQSALAHTINPLSYEHPEDFQRDYLAVSLVKKLDGVPGVSSEARAERALDKYVQSENTLAQADKNLSKLISGGPSTDPSLCTIISMAREKIRSWLGDFDWDEWAKYAHFGPGSSSSCRGFDVSVFEKMSKPSVDTTLALLPILEPFLSATRWGDHVSEITSREYVEVITVPKTALTDRTIGIEPDFNIFVQLGIGGMIRTRLKRVGCDLDYGWERNAELARKGSLDGSLSTVDLSSASDRISYKLVRELLPEDWFSALSRCRTPFAKVGEFPFLMRKFSSMGNGYTFELESMIFLALSQACVQLSGLPVDDVAVFGDDIVVPSEAFALLEYSFTQFGFEINRSKSYSTGYFRESCGAHFFAGRDCKPVYVKDLINDESQFYKIANALRLLSYRVFGVDIHHTRFLPAYRCIVSHIRPHRLCRVPYGYGDGGLCSSFDEVVPHLGRGIRRLSSGHQGFKVRALLPVPRPVKRNDAPSFVGVLYNLHRRSTASIDQQLLSRNRKGCFSVLEPLKFSDLGSLSYSPRPEKRVGVLMRPSWMHVPVWFDPN